jgi:DNA modification methylase
VTEWLNQIHVGDCRVLMRQMRDDGVKVNCIVTSPPYWGLRDYGHPGQFGLERSWVRHVARMRYVFRLARDLLTDDGTLWLNYGDSYITWRPNGGVGSNSTINGQRTQEEFRKASRARKSRISPPDVNGPNRQRQRGLKDKDLVGMPWRVALALQDDGWWLRSDIIWHKPNPMPESTQDRATKSHEYIFMLAKSREYYFDRESVLEDASTNTHPRRAIPAVGVAPDQPKSRPQGAKPVAGWDKGDGAHNTLTHAIGKAPGGRKFAPVGSGTKSNESFSAAMYEMPTKRNTRTVWTAEEEATFFDWFNDQPGSAEWLVKYHKAKRGVMADVWKMPTEGFSAAHFATFPRELVRRCIFAGCPVGGVVFDPFMGSGTVAEVAQQYGRNFIGLELNAEYAAMFSEHRDQQQGFQL